MKLSQEQVAHFDQEGFLFFPDWFSSDEANLLLEEAALVYGLERKEVLRETSGVCLLYTSPSPRDRTRSRMPSSA